MGADPGVSVRVDLDANRATMEIAELFDDDDELRLGETGRGWYGIVREGGRFYWVDTTQPEGDWTRKQPVTERTVRAMVAEHLAGWEVTRP